MVVLVAVGVVVGMGMDMGVDGKEEMVAVVW